MDFTVLPHINYLAVAVSAIIFFFLGAIWFSVLFAKTWVHELSRHNVTIKEPSKDKLLTNMGLTFLKDTIIAFAMACLVHMSGSTTLESGLMLGLIIALGFSATAIAGVFIWESRSIKLFLIDAGYQVIGVILSAVILSVWR